MATVTASTPRRFLKLTEVKKRTALSTSEIYRRVDAGIFPKQIKIGARAVAWLESDIQAWIDACVAESVEGEA